MSRIARFAVLVLILGSASASRADLIINVNYTGDSQFAAAFASAAQIWEDLLQGYQNGVVVARTSGSSYGFGQTVSTVFINASITPGDGVGGVLGSAGFTQRVIDQLGFSLSTDGSMSFDSFDAANLLGNGSWQNVVLHEMAHVLGFGTQWTLNPGIYANGTGEFLGANATAAWQSEFGQTGTPNVELGGGPGTANGHWNEVDGGGALVGITDGLGRDMAFELMTGWLNHPGAFISDMTVASFVDIGFLGLEGTPEPGSCLLAAVGFGALALRRRQRNRRLPDSAKAADSR